MEIFLISFIVIVLAFLGMGAGALVGKTNIKGSCGGLNTLGRLGIDCTGCTEPCDPDKDEKIIVQSLSQHSETSGVCPQTPVFSRRSSTGRPYGKKTHR